MGYSDPPMNESQAAETRDPARPNPPEPDGAEADASEAGEPERLREEIEVLRRESAAAKDLARRAQADLANVRRRADRERGEFRSRALEEVCGSLLPVLDDLELAVAGADRLPGGAAEGAANDPAPNALEALREGVRLVQRRFADTLARQGLVEIDADGALFDPRLHEALHRAAAKPGQRDGEIIQVFRRGYLLDGRVIRPAAVVVAAAPPDEPPAEPEAEGSGAASPRDGEGADGSGAAEDAAREAAGSAAARSNGAVSQESDPASEPIPA